jgi:PEP-CTERM motif
VGSFDERRASIPAKSRRSRTADRRRTRAPRLSEHFINSFADLTGSWTEVPGRRCGQFPCAVPEPTSLALLASGLIGSCSLLAVDGRKRRGPAAADWAFLMQISDARSVGVGLTLAGRGPGTLPRTSVTIRQRVTARARFGFGHTEGSIGCQEFSGKWLDADPRRYPEDGRSEGHDSGSCPDPESLVANSSGDQRGHGPL